MGRLGAKEPDGIEVRLVERPVEELDAEIEWVEGSEQELFGALAGRDLDLVVGGLTAETPGGNSKGRVVLAEQGSSKTKRPFASSGSPLDT